jgi:hypothetical protein
MNKITLINELESLLQLCFNSINNLVKYQQIKENDARVTFFKHLVNVINSTTLMLIMSHTHFGNESWWKDIQREYELSTRPFPFGREIDYYDQVVTNSFLILLFSSFEASIRLIIKQYDATLYQSQKNRFNPLCKELMCKLKLLTKDNDKFIDLVGLLRNSIHNNGVYEPRGSTKMREIEWNNTVFLFVENTPISQPQLWSNLISFSKEILKIFTDIINSNEIKKIRHYSDPAE